MNKIIDIEDSVKLIHDYENDTLDPGDGGEAFTIWWEDMRPGEVRDLVKEAYIRGYKQGKVENRR